MLPKKYQKILLLYLYVTIECTKWSKCSKPCGTGIQNHDDGQQVSSNFEVQRPAYFYIFVKTIIMSHKLGAST